MILRIFILILSMVSLFIPALVHASPCADVTNQMNADITKYSTLLKDQHLSWMSLSWLQRRLGSAHTAKNADGQTQYEWQCPENSGAYVTLIVRADKTGALVDVTGQYSSEDGAGQFSTSFKNSSEPKVYQNILALKQNTDTEVSSPLSSIEDQDVAPDSVCIEVAEQLNKASQHPDSYTGSPYPWEKLSWLQNNLGDPRIMHTANGTAHVWTCGNGRRLSYFVSPEKKVSIISRICSAREECHVSKEIRDGSRVSWFSS